MPENIMDTVITVVLPYCLPKFYLHRPRILFLEAFMTL